MNLVDVPVACIAAEFDYAPPRTPQLNGIVMSLSTTGMTIGIRASLTPCTTGSARP